MWDPRKRRMSPLTGDRTPMRGAHAHERSHRLAAPSAPRGPVTSRRESPPIGTGAGPLRARRDLDRERRARGLARHAVDAIRPADWVALVRAEFVVLRGSRVDRLLLPRPLRARVEVSLAARDPTHVHAPAR